MTDAEANQQLFQKLLSTNGRVLVGTHLPALIGSSVGSGWPGIEAAKFVREVPREEVEKDWKAIGDEPPPKSYFPYCYELSLD